MNILSFMNIYFVCLWGNIKDSPWELVKCEGDDPKLLNKPKET